MAFSFRAGTNWCHDFPKLARESGFYFNMHSTRVRVDWNRISSIDVDRVIRERDFVTVDENVNNVIDYCLESEYDVKILDPNFVKLFRLAQLAVEYLLYCKQYLDHSIVILKDELRLKLENNAKLKKEISILENTIKDLKEKLKEKDRVIEDRISERHGELHKCPHCMKTFISASFVSAHIARRHPNLSDPCVFYTPVHEQYRVETEKLHNEIKTLKERLNQTERVVRNESYMMDVDKVGREERVNSYDDGEHKGIKEQNERMDVQHRRYQEEITSLKNMLFNEIRNFKQKDADVSPLKQYERNSFNPNVKELILQQEKEILNLKDQLHARPTPDLEIMQEKLNVQENFWKSKIEHLESQHSLDTERLTNQLKLTQEAANQMKIEYETKVSDLERQSINQSKILTAQGEQLNHLSRDIQDSQKMDQEEFKHFENSLHQKLNRLDNALKKRQNIRDIEYNHHQGNRKRLRNLKSDTLIFEDVESISSHESPKKLMLTSVQKQCLQEDSNHPGLNDISLESTDETESNKQIILESRAKESVKVEKTSEYSLKQRSSIENLNLESLKFVRRKKVIESSPERRNHEESFSETFKSNSEKQVRGNSKSVFDKNSVLNTTSVEVLNVNDTFKKPQFHGEIKKIKTKENDFYMNSRTGKDCLEKLVVDRKDHRISASESEESELSTETESESEISESETESVKDNEEIQEDIVSAVLSQNYEELAQENSSTLQKLKDNVQKIFDQKIRDLGIDPEWNGIPKETLKQKMETVKHHQNINSKKLTGYNHMRQIIIQELSHRLSMKRNKLKMQGTEKKSPLNKLVTRVKTKAINALNSQKSYDTQKSLLKSQAVIPPRTKITRNKSRIDLLPKKLSQFKIREIDRKNSQIATTENQELKHQFKSKLPSSKTTDQYNSEVNNDKIVETLTESSNGLKQISRSYESIKNLLRDTKTSAEVSEDTFEMTGVKVTSTPNKGAINIMQETYSSTSEKSDSHSMKQEKARSLPVSPKSNKSVLKSTTGSVGSLVKKKVLFDLEKEQESPESPEKETVQTKSLERLFPEFELGRNGINTDNYTFVSSISDEEDRILQKKESTNADTSIVLKTSQSDKIAQISKKIQEQLNISRQKPVGAIEAMFLTKPLPKMEDQKYGNHYPSSTSIASSILESPYKQIHVNAIPENNKIPQPAPRTPKSKDFSLSASKNHISKSEDSNLESDIEELLQME